MKDRVKSGSAFAVVRNVAVAALLAGSLAVDGLALAQEQQAGNEASRNVEETFQALIESCDDVEALMLRARIRLQLSRTTDEARDEAQGLLDQGLALCGEDKLDQAKATLQQSLDIASAGVELNFGQDGGTEIAPAESEATDQSAGADEATPVEAAGPPTAIIAAVGALVVLLGWFWFRRRGAQ